MQFSSMTKTIHRIVLAVFLFALAVCARVATAAGLLPSGAPESWLVTPETYVGPAGMGQYGLDYETRIYPSAGDTYYYTKADKLSPDIGHWQVVSSAGDGTLIFQNSLPFDTAWSKACVYASVYVYASSVVNTDLTYGAKSGYQLETWLDGVYRGTGLVRGTDLVQPLNLSVGWHRLLVKMTTSQKLAALGSDNSVRANIVFKNVFGNLETQTADPYLSGNLQTYHDQAANFPPRILVTTATDSVTNLPRDGEVTQLKVDLTDASLSAPINNVIVSVDINDYDGKPIKTLSSASVSVPGSYNFDLGALGIGYYGVSVSLKTAAGERFMVYPPDGFSVIGDTMSQRLRKQNKKIVATSYHSYQPGVTNDPDRNALAWMQRIGILTMGGGSNALFSDVPSVKPFWDDAANRGLTLSGYWHDIWIPSTVDKAGYANNAAPYTRYFKGMNEIDLLYESEKISNTVAADNEWQYRLATIANEYAAAHAARADAIYTGGSLSSVGDSDYFKHLLSLGLNNYVDEWDIHSYPNFAPILGGDYSGGEFEGERGLAIALIAAGVTNAANVPLINKPVWVGETAAGALYGSGIRWQAETAIKMAAWAMARKGTTDPTLNSKYNPKISKIGFLVPWRYNMEATDIVERTSNYFAVAHKPGEAAYYTASALIDGFGNDVEVLETNTGIERSRFGPTLLVWRAWGTEVPYVLSVPTSGDYVTVDAVGRVTPVVASNQQVTVTPTSMPLFVLLRSDYECLTSPHVPGQVLLDDQFLDGSRNKGGVSGEFDTAWWAVNGLTGGTSWNIMPDNNAPMLGNVLGHSGGSAQNTAMVGDFPGGGYTLARPGDRLRVELVVRSASDVATGAFQLILGNNNGTPMIGDELGVVSPTNADDNLLPAISVNNSSNVFDDGSPHVVELILSLNANGTALDRVLNVDGVYMMADIIPRPTTRTFNQLRLSWNQGALARVDNIRVYVDNAGCTLSPSRPADLSLTQTASPNSIQVGANLVSTVVITNNSPVAASNVKFSDTFDVGLSPISNTITQGTCNSSAQIVSCNLGSLVGGATATVTVMSKANAAGTQTSTAVVTGDEADTNSANNIANTSTAVTPTLAPNGLKGQYYNGRSFNTLITTRTDANVNFDWGTGSPATGVNVDSFSVRWTGKVIPAYSEAYTFFTSTDDGVRLWVNNRLIVDKWKNAPVNSSGVVTLTGGQPYDIKMEYKEAASQARAKLEWRSASQPRVVVPQTALRAAP